MSRDYDWLRIYLLGLFLGAFAAITLILAFQPNCPQEDMCKADYYNGSWHIIEVQP